MGTMRLPKAPALFAAALSLATVSCRTSEPPASGRILPTVSQNEPGPGDPPIVWIAGTVEVLEQGHLAVREGSPGEGPRIRLERLAEGATDFYRLERQGWRELSAEEVDLLDVGDRACVEALLDGRTFLALRVFLGSSCGPSGPEG
jgi:hypothetical protein